MRVAASTSFARSRLSNNYAWAKDTIASYALAIKTLRKQYFEDRLPGESAKVWLDRTSIEI